MNMGFEKERVKVTFPTAQLYWGEDAIILGVRCTPPPPSPLKSILIPPEDKQVNLLKIPSLPLAVNGWTDGQT